MGDRRLFRPVRARSADVETPEQPAPVLDEVAVPAAIPPGSPQAVDLSCVRSLVTVHGTIGDVAVGSRGDAPALEASLADEDAESVVLVWLGRTQIAGIHPGREIVATARICDEGGARVMYNPRYDLR